MTNEGRFKIGSSFLKVGSDYYRIGPVGGSGGGGTSWSVRWWDEDISNDAGSVMFVHLYASVPPNAGAPTLTGSGVTITELSAFNFSSGFNSGGFTPHDEFHKFYYVTIDSVGASLSYTDSTLEAMVITGHDPADPIEDETSDISGIMVTSAGGSAASDSVNIMPITIAASSLIVVGFGFGFGTSVGTGFYSTDFTNLRDAGGGRTGISYRIGPGSSSYSWPVAMSASFSRDKIGQVCGQGVSFNTV